MKHLLAVLIFLFYNINNAQNSILQENVNALKTQIHSEKSKIKKLKLLDSLTALVRDDTSFSYDSISRVTIDYAIKLDSFNIAAENATNLINFHNNMLGQPEEGIAIFNTYFYRLKDHITDRNIANFHIDSGDSYYFAKQVDTAMYHYDMAKKFAKKAGDERGMGFAILYQGLAYSEEGNFTKASQTIQEASKIFNKIKDTFNIISAKNSLSILYSSNGFLTEAREERKEIIALAEKFKSYGQLISVYANEAIDNKKLGLETKRIENLYKAISMSKKSKYFDYFNPLLLNTLVVAYAENDSINKAKFYLQEVEKDKRNTEGIYESEYYNALKNIAFAEKNYIKAQQLGTKHLELVLSLNNILAVKSAEAFLSKVYEKLNKPSLAFSHYKAYKTIEDSIQSVQKVKALSYYQTLYETEKRDQKITEQGSQISLLDEQNKRKQQLLWFGGLLLIGFFSIIYLWRSRKFSENKVRLQKAFAQDLIRNVEAERKRISSELHDSVGQSLLLIKNKIYLSAEKPSDTELIDHAIDEVRHISQSLHPFQFEKLGLIDSIKNTISNFQKNSTTFYSEDIEETEFNISKDKEIFIYRMIQECLNNVEKHAQAKACNIMVEKSQDAVIFQIKDNGIGFDLTENSHLLNSLGMKTLKERAQIIGAQLSINSVLSKGTTVLIKVPKK